MKIIPPPIEMGRKKSKNSRRVVPLLCGIRFWLTTKGDTDLTLQVSPFLSNQDYVLLLTINFSI